MTRSKQERDRRVGIYVRISKWEPPDGDSRGALRQSDGTRRQEDDCRAEAKKRDWSVVEPIYRDDDKSAYTGKGRPGYDRLCDDLKAGFINAVIVWHTDQLHRSLIELEHFIPLIEATGAKVISVTGGDYDLDTDDGRFKARIMGAVARKESEDKSRRLRRKHAALREEGRPNGGNRPYGYRRVGLKVDPSRNNEDTRSWAPDSDEAPIVVEVVGRLARGETLTRVADDLNARGVPTAKNGRTGWSLSNVRRVAVNPIYIGRRTHEGRDIGPGDWPSISDDPAWEGTWRRADALLNAEDRPRRRSARRYLLTGGLIVCGKCGHVLRSKPHHTRQGLIATYACPPTKQGGCGGVSARADAVEQLVAEAAVAHIESAGFAKALHRREGNDPKAVHEVRRIEARRDELAKAYAAESISMREWITARDAVDARFIEAQARLTTDTTTAAVGRYAGRVDALGDEWDDKTLDQRQAILRAIGTTVTVAPVGKGSGNTFDTERVKVRFAV